MQSTDEFDSIAMSNCDADTETLLQYIYVVLFPTWHIFFLCYDYNI